VTATGDAFDLAFAAPARAGFDGRGFSGASRDKTLPFEQIGQSAVKRLCRQKSEFI
jgi:hypothetical protein